MRTLTAADRDEAAADLDEGSLNDYILVVYRINMVSHGLRLGYGMLLVESDQNGRSHLLWAVSFGETDAPELMVLDDHVLCSGILSRHV
jgi:hypothetical protein